MKQLIFEVTDACNLRCKYCAYAELYEGYDKRENLHFPFQRAKLIIDYLYHNYWKKKICKDITRIINISFYGGEPLLDVPFIQQVICYIESLPYIGITFRYGMTSNGVLLDRYMDFLVEKNFFLLLSLDGDEKGQSYRLNASGRNSFPDVVRNIRLLKEAYPSFFKDNVQFNSVLHDRNSVESTFSFIKETFDKTPAFSALNDTDVREDKMEDFRSMYKNMAKDLKLSANCGMLEKVLFVNAPQTALLVDYLRNYSENFYNSYVSLLIDKKKIALHPTATCIPFQRKMFVTVNGKILQCEKINHDFALGRVTDTEVILDIENVVGQHNKHISAYLKQCKTCAINRRCKRCVYMFGNPLKDKECFAYTTAEELEKEKKTSLLHLEKNPELYQRILTEVKIRE